MKIDSYQIITERLIARLQDGVAPWQKPWRCATNAISKKAYRGINALMLGTSQYASPYWMTYKQAQELKGTVRKGEKSEIVVYFTVLDRKDKEGNPILNAQGRKRIIPFLRYSNVFNLEQTENVEFNAPTIATGSEALDCSKAQEIVAKTIAEGRAPNIFHEGSHAYYSPALDVVRMPGKTSFNSEASYYHVLFHELTHATGHKSRLDRELGNGFGNEKYAKEELIAELGASFLSNDAGTLGNVAFDNAAGYLDNWIAVLKKDTKLIVSASSAAQRASEFIQGKNQNTPVKAS